MQLKAHHHLAIVSLILLGITGVWTWGTMVFASASTINVTIGTDSCPNIPGFQNGIPSGMAVDVSGNCYTPPATGSRCMFKPSRRSVGDSERLLQR